MSDEPSPDAPPVDEESPPADRSPSFGGAVLVLWAVNVGVSSVRLLFLASRGSWPPYAVPLSAHLAVLPQMLATFAPRAIEGVLLDLVYLLFTALVLVAMWKRRERVEVFVPGVLTLVPIIIEWSHTAGHHDVWVTEWLLFLAGSIGLLWAGYPDLPRSSRGLVALFGLAALLGRGASLLMPAVLGQIGWVFLSGQRTLVKRRDTNGRLNLRRKMRERVELAGVLLIAFVYPMAWDILVGRGERHISTPASYISAIPREIGIALLVLVILLRDSKFRAQVPRTRTGWLYEVGFGLWLCLLGAGVQGLVQALTIVPYWPSSWSTTTYTPHLRGVLAVESLFSAFYEETVFRAFLITRLRPILWNSAGMAVLVSSTLFALMHGYSPRGTISIFAFGLVMGFAFVRTRSLTRLVIAHWVYNAVSFVWFH